MRSITSEEMKAPFLRDCRNVAAEYAAVTERRRERAKNAIEAGCTYREVAEAMGKSAGWIYQMVNGTYYGKRKAENGN